MGTGAMIAAVIGAAMFLTLNWRALRSHALGTNVMVKWALIWAALLVGLTLIISTVKL